MIVVIAALAGVTTGVVGALSRRRGSRWGMNLSIATYLIILITLALTQPSMGYWLIVMVISFVVSFTMLMPRRNALWSSDPDA